MARIRTFIGLDIGESIRSQATALQRKLAQLNAAVNWTAPANYHITLQFLGDVDDRDLADICREVAKVAANEPPFRLCVSGLGAFPTPRRPKILWAGLSEGADELRKLYAALEKPLTDIGVYRKEDRPYTPHVTLGRARDEAAGLALAPMLIKYRDWVGGAKEVDEVLIFNSELRRDGAEYTVIGRGPLSGRRRSSIASPVED